MRYVDILLLIEQRGETTLAQEARAIITDAHRYLRELDAAEDAWIEDTEPGKPEQRYGRGGSYYAWKREEASDDVPIQLPDGT